MYQGHWMNFKVTRSKVGHTSATNYAFVGGLVCIRPKGNLIM